MSALTEDQDQDAPLLVCYTAPGVQFASPQALREHYKTDWHRYNLKRKVAGLPPISALSFTKRREAALALRAQSSEPEKGTSHLNKSKQSKKQRKKAAAKSPKRSSPTNNDQKQQEGETKTASNASSTTTATTSSAMKPSSDPSLNLEGINLDTVTATQLRAAANPLFSIFDKQEFQTIEDNMEYMYTKYNFQLPDTKFIDDLSGLVKYCVAKVRLGRMCVYCEKGFGTIEGCQQHMKDQNHCRLPVANEDTYFEEYGEFYDFSSEEVSGKDQRTVEMMDNGELLLTDANGKNSKIIGTRQFKHVYDQNVVIEDERESVIAAKKHSKAKLLLMCERLGISTRTSSDGTLSKYVKFQTHQKVHKQVQIAQHRAAKYRQNQATKNNLLQKNHIAGAGARFALGVGVHG